MHVLKDMFLQSDQFFSECCGLYTGMEREICCLRWRRSENIILLALKDRIHAAAGLMLNILIGSYPCSEVDKQWGNKKNFPFYYLAFAEQICSLFRSKICVEQQLHFAVPFHYLNSSLKQLYVFSSFSLTTKWQSVLLFYFWHIQCLKYPRCLINNATIVIFLDY